MSRIEAGDPRRELDELNARTDAIILRTGGVHLKNPHRDVHLFANLDLLDHANEYLESRGRPREVSPVTAFTRNVELSRSDDGPMGSSSLPNLLANVAKKAALAGSDNTPAPFEKVVRPGSVVSFRQESRVGLSEVNLEPVPEGGIVPRAKRSDWHELITVQNYSKIYSISREIVFGDETGALIRNSAAFGRGAKMTVQKEFTRVLTSHSGTGPTLNQDGLALFHSSHGNYVSSSGAPPSVTTLDAARKAMRTRTDPKTGNVLNIVPAVLYVPAALETVARTLAAAQNSALGDAEGDLLVAVDPGLDAVSTTAWYLFADPIAHDVFEVAYLDGHAAPIVEVMTAWSTDGTEVRVSLPFGLAALDFRGAYRNVGA